MIFIPGSNLQGTAAEVVTTGCLGCPIQLQRRIHNWVLKIKAKPFIEVLGEMIAETGKEAEKT